MIIYVDSNFRCHLTNDGSMTEVKTDFFDGKCAVFVEGYCYEDRGNCCIAVYPWKDFSELDAAQQQYEKDLADRAELEAAYNYLLTGGILK